MPHTRYKSQLREDPEGMTRPRDPEREISIARDGRRAERDLERETGDSWE